MSQLSLLFPQLSFTFLPVISHLISTCHPPVLLAVYYLAPVISHLISTCLSTVHQAVSPVLSAVSYLAPIISLLISTCLSPVFLAVSPVPSAVSPVPSAVSPVPSAVSPVPSAVSPFTSAVSPFTSAASPVTSAVSPVTSAVSPVPSAVSTVPSAVSPVPSAVSPVPSAVSYLVSQPSWHLTQSSPGPLQSKERKGISCLSFHFSRINCVVVTHNHLCWSLFSPLSLVLSDRGFLLLLNTHTHTHRGPSSWHTGYKTSFLCVLQQPPLLTSQPLANSLLWPPVNHRCCSNDVLLPTMTLSSLRKFPARTGPH